MAKKKVGLEQLMKIGEIEFEAIKRDKHGKIISRESFRISPKGKVLNREIRKK